MDEEQKTKLKEQSLGRVEPIHKLLKYVLLSGFIDDGWDSAPLSLTLIAKPESAKTSIETSYICDGVLVIDDISQKGIWSLITQLKENKLHHIIIKDLVRLTARRRETSQSTIAFFNGLIEEGLDKNLFLGQEYEGLEGKKCGLVTSITPEEFIKQFRKWRDIGFLTRTIPVSYEYSVSMINLIDETIKNEVVVFTKTNIDNKYDYKNRIKVEIPENIADEINLLKNRKVEELKKFSVTEYLGNKPRRVTYEELIGTRLHKQLRLLTKSIAFVNHPQELTVKARDVLELTTLLEYIKLPNEPKVI